MFNRLHRRSGRCRNNNNDKEMAGSENEELRIMNMFAEQTLSKSISQLRQEFERLMTLEPRNNVYTSCHQNPRRNRNPNILCPDATRVKLTINVPPDTDYINANWIRFDGIDREFIATQFSIRFVRLQIGLAVSLQPSSLHRRRDSSESHLCMRRFIHNSIHVMSKSAGKSKSSACLSVLSAAVDEELKAISTNKRGEIVLRIRAKPGAKLSQIIDVGESEVGVSLAAPPREGQANQELIDTIIRFLGIRKSEIDFDKGAKSRSKVLVISTSRFSEDEIRKKLINCAASSN